VHKQVCMEMGPEGPGDEIFREHSISMVGLKERISPKVNLLSSPCLFQYLSETLDKRMLGVLCNKDFDKLPFKMSINLNASTALSRGFQKFDRIVGKNTAKVIVEMQLLDIFADMCSFVQARDSLQERGYRVLVDGLNPLALKFFDPGLLKADFIKINWDSDYEGEVKPDLLKDLLAVIASTGKERVILARVNTNKAIKWGMGLGITKFQGFFIDALMEKVAGVRTSQAKVVPKIKAIAQAAKLSKVEPTPAKSTVPIEPKPAPKES
jgi:EAL domain-containing protein (putative c-di-GMP-specific phosphodiesterase class I)